MSRAWLSGVLAACGVDHAVPPPEPPPPPAHPDLVVVLVVDQLPARLLAAVAPDSRGGWSRFTAGYVATARHRHLATETCPGHAAVSTGASPHRSGIVGNGWREGGAAVYCLGEGRTPERLRAEALADTVTDAGGRAVALALKDRSAVMLGGHHPTAALYFERGGAGLVGEGRDRLGALPDWRCVGERRWEVPPERAARHAARFPDAQLFEADPAPTFPHVSPCDDPRRFFLSPDAGGFVVDAAIAAVDQLELGRGGHKDLLALSFSHVDAVGHTYTPDSWEALEVVERLDGDLARLFAHLDATLGADRWAAALTSDHGAPGSPRRIPVAVEDAAVAAAREAVGDTAEGLVFEEPWVWVPDPTPERRAAALAALRGALDGVEGVLAVVDPGDRATWPDDPKLAEALALGTFPGRSGDLAVLRRDGWQWSVRSRDGSGNLVVDDRGTTHGSTDDLDQRVPLWFTGAGVARGSAAHDLDVRQLAGTVAALLGVPVPRDAEVAPVREALARE